MHTMCKTCLYSLLRKRTNMMTKRDKRGRKKRTEKVGPRMHCNGRRIRLECCIVLIFVTSCRRNEVPRATPLMQEKKREGEGVTLRAGVGCRQRQRRVANDPRSQIATYRALDMKTINAMRLCKIGLSCARLWSLLDLLQEAAKAPCTVGKQ
jgi:hypothetical protein